MNSPKYDTWATNARVNKDKTTVALFSNDMCRTNRAKNPDLLLRNADVFHVPTHKMASVKRFPHLLLPKIQIKLYFEECWNCLTQSNCTLTVFLPTLSPSPPPPYSMEQKCQILSLCREGFLFLPCNN